MYTSMSVLLLKSQHGHVTSEKYSGLLESIETIGYTLSILQIENIDEEFEQILQKQLKISDLVLGIGGLTEFVSRTIAQVYDEHWNFTKEVNENNEYKHFQVIRNHNTNVLWCHRFYFVEYNCAVNCTSDFTEFLRLLQYFKRKPIYTKIFKYENNDKVKQYINYLLGNENGVKTAKHKENEILVRSNKLCEINNLQKHLEMNCIIENSWVMEENEELILDSSCTFIQEAIKHIRTCFDTYQPENVFISFNGGKDCTVLLHLMLIVLKKYYPEYKQPVYCMYVQSKKPFSQVNEFIEQCRTFYNLEINTLTLGIKDGLKLILEEKPHLKACLLGTRRTDPFSAELHHFQKTDNGWPEIMRVSPLLDWEFAHIWDYLLNFKVPYCQLYDEGYTSLGNVDNTIKNPQLFDEDSGKYFPAYKLLTSVKERSGRT